MDSMPFYVNPNMRDLRESLDGMGIPYDTDDGEEIIEDEDFLTHCERTGFTSKSGDWVSVLYSWTRDWDERKRGASMGWPAYLECKVGDAMPRIMDVDEIMELVR